MNTPAPTNTCRQCGGPMASNAPEGLCARCLLSVAMKEPEAGDGSGVSGVSDVSDKSDESNLPASDIPDIGDAAEVARRLPQFEIQELLGRGGMGVVYKARQLNLDRIVALKILPPADALTPDFVERFRREARSLAKLSHPNIVSVYEIGESGGLYYFVMEFVDGVNLRAMIRAGKMKPEEALAVVPKICDALQFAHEEGVVHRDIKPENILIDKRGRVKIADFGLAKLLRREQTDNTLTMSGMTLGTPRYMAPEQMDKPETVDHRADIYSLGVVFYEMLTGEVPMGRFAPPSERVQIDVRLDEIVLHALERDADRRYQHASQVWDDVEKVTSKPQGMPVPPKPGTPSNEAKAGTEKEVLGNGKRRWLIRTCLVIAGIGAGLMLLAPFVKICATILWLYACSILGVTSIFILIGACLEIFQEWWKTESSFLRKVLRTILLLTLVGCAGIFLQATTTWNPNGGTEFTIGAPFPWFEFGAGGKPGWQFKLAWSWGFFALGWLCLYAWRESFKSRLPANESRPAAAPEAPSAAPAESEAVRRARASWFGQRSERFRTLLPPALIFLELVFILGSFAVPSSQWFEWTRTYTPHKHGVGGEISSFAFHPFTLSFLLLLIGFALPFAAARFGRIDNLVRYGRSFRELQKEIRRAAKFKIFGCLGVAMLLPFLLVLLFAVMAPGGLRSTAFSGHTEYRLIPNSKAYDELLIDMPFFSRFENGVEHYRRPKQWDMTIGLKTKDSAEPVTMDIEMPSFEASYPWKAGQPYPVNIVLDLEELTKWMANQGNVDVKDEKVQKEAAELMALLKRFSHQAPANANEYLDAQAEEMRDFRMLGYKGLDGSFSTSNGGWVMGIYLGSAVLGLALYFVVAIRIQRAAFALDREVRERGESVLARSPLPRVKFGALPRDIRRRTIRRAALVATGLLLLPGLALLAARWEAAQPTPVKQTWHYEFKPRPIPEKNDTGNGAQMTRPSPLLKHFQEVILTFTAFESYQRNGEMWFVHPRELLLELTFCRPKDFSDKPGEFHEVIQPGKGVPEGETFSFTVELPGLHANMDYISYKSSVTLDEEELLRWMENTIATTTVRPNNPPGGFASRGFQKPDGTQANLYSLPMSETPELKSLAGDLMAFLKQYARFAPTTREAFIATAKKIPSLSGYSSSTTFHAEGHGGVTIIPAFAAAIVIFLALLPVLKRSAVRAAMRRGVFDVAAQTAAPAGGTKLPEPNASVAPPGSL